MPDARIFFYTNYLYSNERSSVNLTIFLNPFFFREPELSKNKTSRACQRRMNYMIKNSDTMKNVSVYLSEIKTSDEVLKRYPVPKRGEISREDNDKRHRYK